VRKTSSLFCNWELICSRQKKILPIYNTWNVEKPIRITVLQVDFYEPIVWKQSNYINYIFSSFIIISLLWATHNSWVSDWKNIVTELGRKTEPQIYNARIVGDRIHSIYSPLNGRIKRAIGLEKNLLTTRSISLVRCVHNTTEGKQRKGVVVGLSLYIMLLIPLTKVASYM